MKGRLKLRPFALGILSKKKRGKKEERKGKKGEGECKSHTTQERENSLTDF